MLKLIFSGELVTGFERDVVVANLARLLKQTPEAIEKNLFAGKAVVVKRVESAAIADKWIKAFIDAGAVLQSAPLEEALPATTPADVPADPPAIEVTNPNASPAQSSALKQSPARRRRKAFLALGIPVSLALAALIFLLWTIRPLWQTVELNQQQQAIANALAGENLYALGHINFNRIQSLEALAQRETDLAALPGVDESFWGSLEQAGINVRAQVQHLWFAGYYAQKKGEALLVLTGEFNPAQVGRWLKQRYIVEAENADGFMVTWLDERSCEKQPLKQVVITDKQILLGSPAQITAFQTRLQTHAQAIPDLTSWHKISSTQLASLAVLVPENIDAAMGGLAGYMLKETVASARPASGFYLGLEPVTLPPGVEVSVVMTSEDAAFLREAHAGVNARLQEAKIEAAQNWPETLPLYERLSLTRSDDQLRAAIRFDENLQQELGNWISAFFSAAFSMGDSTADAQEEKLDDNPPQFFAVTNTAFPGFNEHQHLDTQFSPAATTGPFGIELKHLEIGEEGSGIALEFMAFNLPNIESLGSGLSMRITDVLDSNGNSLAPAPACGPDKIRESVDIGNVWSSKAYIDDKEIPYTSISGNKTISLPGHVLLDDVAAITGVFDYQLPQAVETIQLQSPLAGQVIEKYGLRIRFLNSDENSLRYTYSGNVEALLHVAGLNADAKPLARQSRMRSGILFGSGHSVSENYKGKIAGVQVTLAANLSRLSYPFKLTALQPPAGDSTWPLKPQPAAITNEQWQALQMDKPPEGIDFWREPKFSLNLGPVLFVAQDISFNEHFGMHMEAETYIRNQHPLTGVMGGVEVAVTELIRRNGEVLAIDLRAQFPLDHDGGYWMNDKFIASESSPWLRGKAQLRSGEMKATDIAAMRGTVSLNRAQTIVPVYLPAELGAQWSNEQFNIKMVRWEKGRLVFSTSGNISGLVAIQALDLDGAIVSQPADLNWIFGKTEITLDIQALPRQLLLLMADATESAAYPFEIILPD